MLYTIHCFLNERFCVWQVPCSLPFYYILLVIWIWIVIFWGEGGGCFKEFIVFNISVVFVFEFLLISCVLFVQDWDSGRGGLGDAFASGSMQRYCFSLLCIQQIPFHFSAFFDSYLQLKFYFQLSK